MDLPTPGLDTPAGVLGGTGLGTGSLTPFSMTLQGMDWPSPRDQPMGLSPGPVSPPRLRGEFAWRAGEFTDRAGEFANPRYGNIWLFSRRSAARIYEIGAAPALGV
eukprot:1191796-Prorocentrum_minimum.AAC.5